MDIQEFELRRKCFTGLAARLDQTRDEATIADLVARRATTLDRPLKDLSPEEIRDLATKTYTDSKKSFLQKNQEIPAHRHTIADYIARLEYELKVIHEMDYDAYFLIVHDFIARAITNKIAVGLGRGSAAGSLMSRTLQITNVDPMLFDLLFERFLNPYRVSLPDIDIDFEDQRRDEVINYIKEKYNSPNVCAIGTFMELADKAAFKDAARTLGVPFDKANAASRLFPEKVEILDAIDDSENYPDLAAIFASSDKLQEAAKLGHDLNGNLRQIWVHACGIIIAPEPVVNFTATQPVRNSEMQVSQFDGPTLETIGLVKMDILWLRNLSVIRNCVKILEKKFQKSGEPLPDVFQKFLSTGSFEPDLTDQKVYETVFQAGETTGIFQFEWQGMRHFLVQLRPNHIDDLIAMNALYRPGPMDFIPSYIKRKHGEEEISYLAPDLAETLEKTYDAQTRDDEGQKLEEDLTGVLGVSYGIPVYQEQLMMLVQKLAGFSFAEADLLRRWVGKKKKDVIEKLKKEFIEKGGKFRDYKPETLTRVYEKMIEPAASYSFNKSHSACYALTAYQTAYLKTHYPSEFFAALMRSVEEDTETLAFFITEAQDHGIEVKTPAINESFTHVASIDDHVRLGFLAIRGIGFEVSETIQEERKNSGNFSSIEDFLTRCEKSINKKVLEWLVKSGALDEFHDRKFLRENVSTMLDRTKNSAGHDGGLFGPASRAEISRKKIDEKATTEEKCQMEFDCFKTNVATNPLDGLYLFAKKFGFRSAVSAENTQGPFRTLSFIKNIQRAKKKWFFITREDLSGKTETFFSKIDESRTKFDLFIVEGYKGQRIKIDKLTRVALPDLVRLADAAGKFDPDETARQIKKKRAGTAPDPAETPPEKISETLTDKKTDQSHSFLPSKKNPENSEKNPEKSWEKSPTNFWNSDEDFPDKISPENWEKNSEKIWETSNKPWTENSKNSQKNWEKKSDQKSQKKSEKTWENPAENSPKNWEKTSDETPETTDQILEFPLPDDVEKIRQILQLLQSSHDSDTPAQKIKLGSREFSLPRDKIQTLRELLQK